MTTPEPNEPITRSMPEPEDLAMELEVPGEAEEMAEQNDPRYGTTDQEEQP
jgi:hypothetical protein